jgi:hypothetical protein
MKSIRNFVVSLSLCGKKVKLEQLLVTLSQAFSICLSLEGASLGHGSFSQHGDVMKCQLELHHSPL